MYDGGIAGIADMLMCVVTHSPPLQELQLSHYGFTEADLDREFHFAGVINTKGFLDESMCSPSSARGERVHARLRADMSHVLWP